MVHLKSPSAFQPSNMRSMKLVAVRTPAMSTVILSLHVNGGRERAGPIHVYCLFVFISFAEYCYPWKRSHYV